jgi:hypothetical protein
MAPKNVNRTIAFEPMMLENFGSESYEIRFDDEGGVKFRSGKAVASSEVRRGVAVKPTAIAEPSAVRICGNGSVRCGNVQLSVLSFFGKFTNNQIKNRGHSKNDFEEYEG